jgi:hypothetical protein
VCDSALCFKTSKRGFTELICRRWCVVIVISGCGVFVADMDMFQRLVNAANKAAPPKHVDDCFSNLDDTHTVVFVFREDGRSPVRISIPLGSEVATLLPAPHGEHWEIVRATVSAAGCEAGHLQLMAPKWVFVEYQRGCEHDEAGSKFTRCACSCCCTGPPPARSWSG